MCRLTFLQYGCVPGVCARDLVSDCQALIRQCNAAVFSVGEDTGRAGAGRQEGAVRQRQEVWRLCGDKEDGLQIYMPAASLSSHHAVGLGLNGEGGVHTGARAQTPGRLADVLQMGVLGTSRCSCDKG